METFRPEVPPEASHHQEYRQELAETLLSEDDFYARREQLRHAQRTREYEEARQWWVAYRQEVGEHRHLATERYARGLITEEQTSLSQYDITEAFQKELAANPSSERLYELAADPSPFVRFEVLSRVSDHENPLLLHFTNDSNPELKSYARRAMAINEVEALRKISDQPNLAFTTSDLYTDVPAGTGERFFIIQRADRQQLQNTYGLADEELDNLHLPYHFKVDADLDLMWWGCVDIQVLPDGQKAWLLEEAQSDVLSKTRNKVLKQENFNPCGDCSGKGMIPQDHGQTPCQGCLGAARLPNYPGQLLRDLTALAAQRGVTKILMPTAESMLEKHAGLLKPTKAKVHYDTIPRQLGLTPLQLDYEISFGQEDGGRVSSRQFWSLAVEESTTKLGPQYEQKDVA